MELVVARVMVPAKLLAAAGLTATALLGLVMVSLAVQEFALTFLLIQAAGWALAQVWDWALEKESVLALVPDLGSESPLEWGLAPESVQE